MSKRKKQTEKQKRARQAHAKRYNKAIEKRAEKETHRLQREIEAVQNKNSHFVKDTSIKEQQRIAISMLPKEKKEIENIREYRKKRRKLLK
jgi:hypothetical protein